MELGGWGLEKARSSVGHRRASYGAVSQTELGEPPTELGVAQRDLRGH